MKRTISIFMTQAILVILIAAVCTVSHAVANTITPPIHLKANSILDKNLLYGKNYTINSKVMNDGVINTYYLTTDYGQFAVESTAGLMKRIDELNSIKAMEDLEQSGIFKDSLVKGVKAPVQGAIDLVKSPIKTTKGFITGTGKFLSNMGRAIVSSDPHQDNALKVALGYDAAKRAYAYEFGIDPYSTFEPLVDRLGKIARAATVGGFVPRATMSALDHDIVTVMQVTAATKNLGKLVRDSSPNDLHKINKAKLEKLGIHPTQIESFLSNYSYNPQEKTMLIGALEQMNNVQGLGVFIAAADTVGEFSDAQLYLLIAQMMAQYHTRIDPVNQIINIDGTMHLMIQPDTLVLAVPADFIFKTDPVIAKLDNLDKKIKPMSNVNRKRLWITGDIDKSALEMFEARGWEVVIHSYRILGKE
jgi:hypothetical protein